MWFLTVFGLMWSSPAIIALSLPFAISFRTWISRSESSARIVSAIADTLLVERLTAEDARAYYASHYSPGNAVLAIAGDFVPSEAKALVARSFADVPARPVAQPNLTTELPQRGERRTILHGAVDRQYFQMAFPGPAASSADFPAFLVLQHVVHDVVDLEQQGPQAGEARDKMAEIKPHLRGWLHAATAPIALAAGIALA